MPQLLFFTWSLLQFFIATYSDMRPVKIIEGMNYMESPSATTCQPNEFIGHEDLSFLIGTCFSSTSERFQYHVCPFHNITRERPMGQPPLLIGVWDRWMGIAKMEYRHGDDCGRTEKRSTTVVLIPNQHEYTIISASEETPCHYEITLGLPIPEILLEKNYKFIVNSDKKPSSENHNEFNRPLDEIATASELKTLVETEPMVYLNQTSLGAIHDSVRDELNGIESASERTSIITHEKRQSNSQAKLRKRLKVLREQLDALEKDLD